MKNDSGYNTRQKEKLLSYLISNKDEHTNVAGISAYLAAEGFEAMLKKLDIIR